MVKDHRKGLTAPSRLPVTRIPDSTSASKHDVTRASRTTFLARKYFLTPKYGHQHRRKHRWNRCECIEETSDGESRRNCITAIYAADDLLRTIPQSSKYGNLLKQYRLYRLRRRHLRFYHPYRPRHHGSEPRSSRPLPGGSHPHRP